MKIYTFPIDGEHATIGLDDLDAVIALGVVGSGNHNTNSLKREKG